MKSTLRGQIVKQKLYRILLRPMIYLQNIGLRYKYLVTKLNLLIIKNLVIFDPVKKYSVRGSNLREHSFGTCIAYTIYKLKDTCIIL